MKDKVPTTCVYCSEPATGYTLPPMCEAHEAMAMLIEYLQDTQAEVTGEALVDLANQCRKRNGGLFIDDEDILTMYPRMIDEVKTISYQEVTPQ